MPADKHTKEDSELTQLARRAQAVQAKASDRYSEDRETLPGRGIFPGAARAGAGQRAVANLIEREAPSEDERISERTAADMRRTAYRQDQAQKKDNKKRGYAKGGSVGFKHDGIAKSGKTKGKFR